MEKDINYGIDIKKIINFSNQDELICPICHNVFLHPVSCGNCDNNFCMECIESWLMGSGNTCINRCKYIPRKSPPMLKRLLSKLNVICKNSERGCEDKISYDVLDSHEKACQYKEEQCVGCKKPFLKKDILKHLDDCEMIETKCEPCGLVMTRLKFSIHDSRLCMENRIKNLSEDNTKKQLWIDSLIKELEEMKKKFFLSEENVTSLSNNLQHLNNKISIINSVEEKCEKVGKKINNLVENEFKLLKLVKTISKATSKEIFVREYIGEYYTAGFMFSVLAKKKIVIQEIGFMANNIGKFDFSLYFLMGSYKGKEKIPEEWKLLFQGNINSESKTIVTFPVHLNLFVETNNIISFYIFAPSEVDSSKCGYISVNEVEDSSFDDADMTILNGTCSSNKIFKNFSNTQNSGYVGKFKYLLLE
jgi:hypothetical protein